MSHRLRESGRQWKPWIAAIKAFQQRASSLRRVATSPVEIKGRGRLDSISAEILDDIRSTFAVTDDSDTRMLQLKSRLEANLNAFRNHAYTLGYLARSGVK